MNKSLLNEMTCTFTAVSENESFARTIAASFISQASPTVSQLADVKCAVSEAVTNCIVHAYPPDFPGKRFVKMTISRFDDNSVIITISDKGIGIPDVEAARAPLYTTDTTGERSGHGLCDYGRADGRLSRKVKSWFWDSRDNENQAGSRRLQKLYITQKWRDGFADKRFLT